MEVKKIIIQLKNNNLQIYFGVSGIPNLTPIQNVAEKSNEPQKADINSIEFYTSRKDYASDNICLYAVTQLRKVNFHTNPNAYYVLNLQAKTTNEGSVKLFNHILSTFKFTN